MKIASFQFAASYDIQQNYSAIVRGINQSIDKNIEILLTQECALCGYLEKEIDNIEEFKLYEQDHYQNELQKIIDKTNICLVLGRIIEINDKLYNVVVLLNPNEPCSYYAKRALWGYDKHNFSEGTKNGLFEIGNLNIGTRICYEVRFPEYFRELFIEKIPIVFISFADTSDNDNIDRYELIKGHLRTRAVENSMYVVSSNDISKNQTAPTLIIDPDGKIIEIAPRNIEKIIMFDYKETTVGFGRQGRIEHSKYLCNMQNKQ
jgi:omega-amidase